MRDNSVKTCRPPGRLFICTRAGTAGAAGRLPSLAPFTAQPERSIVRACAMLLLGDVLHERHDAEHQERDDEHDDDHAAEAHEAHSADLHDWLLSHGGCPDYTTRGVCRMSKREKCGRRYRKLVARQRSLGLPCWICGGAIRYDLPAGHPLSFEYDHYRPSARWREFGYASQYDCIHDPGNGRSAHRICNEKRQDAMPWEKAWKRLGRAEKCAPSTPMKRSRAE